MSISEFSVSLKEKKWKKIFQCYTRSDFICNSDLTNDCQTLVVFFFIKKTLDFRKIWAIKPTRMFLTSNFGKFFLQELSETLSWYDNFAFLTEGVFMVSLRQLVIRKARKFMKKNLCTSFVMSHLNLMMCFRHSIRFGQSICPFRQS